MLPLCILNQSNYPNLGDLRVCGIAPLCYKDWISLLLRYAASVFLFFHQATETWLRARDLSLLVFSPFSDATYLLPRAFLEIFRIPRNPWFLWCRLQDLNPRPTDYKSVYGFCFKVWYFLIISLKINRITHISSSLKLSVYLSKSTQFSIFWWQFGDNFCFLFTFVHV